MGIAFEVSSLWTVWRTDTLCLLFAGHSEACRFAKQHGHSTSSVEYAIEFDQDVTRLTGMLWALWCIMSFKVGGLLWCSPECRTWL
eukprot:6978936-Pyramimonas_sp.AAC.1